MPVSDSHIFLAATDLAPFPESLSPLTSHPLQKTMRVSSLPSEQPPALHHGQEAGVQPPGCILTRWPFLWLQAPPWPLAPFATAGCDASCQVRHTLGPGQAA